MATCIKSLASFGLILKPPECNVGERAILALQVRKGKKHTAEYKADKPLCGTWAEIDGQLTALLLLYFICTLIITSAVSPDWRLIYTLCMHFMCSDLTADESVAPMDDFLRSRLPADVIPAIMNHLPELNVNQPDKVEILDLSRSKQQHWFNGLPAYF